jgi:hypothetical protein
MMMVTTFAVATPHALVLTVSHGCCSANPLIYSGMHAAISPGLNVSSARSMNQGNFACTQLCGGAALVVINPQ